MFECTDEMLEFTSAMVGGATALRAVMTVPVATRGWGLAAEPVLLGALLAAISAMYVTGKRYGTCLRTHGRGNYADEIDRRMERLEQEQRRIREFCEQHRIPVVGH